MKFMKEHNLMLLLSGIALGLCVLAVICFCFIFDQQNTINAQLNQLREQEHETIALTVENSSLKAEIEDLKELYANVSVDLEKLEEFKQFEEGFLDELKNALP